MRAAVSSGQSVDRGLGTRHLVNPGTPGLDGMLAEAFPAMAEVASQVAAVLTRHGLVTEPFYANGVVGSHGSARRSSR